MPLLPDVTSVETGTSGNDRLVADALVSNLTDTNYSYTFNAEGGDDTVIGSAGPLGWASLTAGQAAPVLRVENDIYGGGGNDLLIASSGYSQILNDAQKLGYSVNNFMFGGDGNDVLRGSRFNDELYGGVGLDTIYGGRGDDFILGLEDNDRLLGGAGNDYVSGNAGDDLNWGDAGDDSMWGGEGNDQLVGGVGNDTLRGETENDSLYGGAGNDELSGGAGDDYMVGGSGDNTFIGGTGNDTYRLSGPYDTVTELAGGGIDIIQATGIDLFDSDYQHVEILQLIGGANTSIYASDYATTLIGNRGNNTLDAGTASSTLRGGDGNDSLYGSDADDVFYGGRHNDEMTGYFGNDWFNVDSVNDVVLEIVAQGNDTVSSAAISLAASNFGNIEVLELVGEADLNLTGGGWVTEMRGNAGDNTITTSGNLFESVYGGAGNDTIHLSNGSDTLTGGDGADVFVFEDLALDHLYGVTITDFNRDEDKFDVSGLPLSPGSGYNFTYAGGVATLITLLYNDSRAFTITLTGVHGITDDHFIGLVPL